MFIVEDLSLIRMDPDCCYMSNEMLDTLHHDLGINNEVVPGEAPWKLSITGVIMRLVKRTAHIYALDQGRDASCQECLLQAVMAHSRLLKHGGYTPLQLLFRHEPAPIEGEAFDDEQQNRSITVSMARDLQDSSQPRRRGCKPKPNLALNEHRIDAHVSVQHWSSGSRVCSLESRRSEYGFFAHDSAGVYGNSEKKHKGAWLGLCDSSGSGDGSESRAT